MEIQIKQGNYESNFIYDEDNELGFFNADCFEVYCELYFVGDLEFLFVMVFQSVFLGGPCIFCKLKQSECVSHNGNEQNRRVTCHAPLCTTEELILPYIDAQVN